MEDEVFNASSEARKLFRDPAAAMAFIDEFAYEKELQWLSAIGKESKYIKDLWGFEPIEKIEFNQWCSVASLLASLYGIDSYQLSRMVTTHSQVKKRHDGGLPVEIENNLTRALFEFDCLDIAVENKLDDSKSGDTDQRTDPEEWTPAMTRDRLCRILAVNNTPISPRTLARRLAKDAIERHSSSTPQSLIVKCSCLPPNWESIK